jgi:hypothetical protein
VIFFRLTPQSRRFANVSARFTKPVSSAELMFAACQAGFVVVVKAVAVIDKVS